ncbi:uncharacterized protein [Rutidosis leptorrhynchoides]|uniref:uncharacterized protein n=1 Tax=Rutidosis leptorrhynchoides TaxID=125765 RepID=UPI003A99860F
MDTYSRLYALERALSDVAELVNLLSLVRFQPITQDRWRWCLGSDGVFKSKLLSSMIDEKKLLPGNQFAETSRNKSIPQKVEIFVWRAKLNRLPVRSELDKRGMDLDTILCPICGDETKSVDHLLFKCKKVIEFWKFFLKWWNIPDSRLNSLDPLNTDSIFGSFSKHGEKIWEAVKWVCCYSLWKARNNKVFKNKEWNISSILSEVQSLSFGWISKRLKKAPLEWHQWNINPGFYVDTSNIRTGIG